MCRQLACYTASQAHRNTRCAHCALPRQVGSRCLPRVMAALAGSSTRILYCHTRHRYDLLDAEFFAELEAGGLCCEEVRRAALEKWHHSACLMLTGGLVYSGGRLLPKEAWLPQAAALRPARRRCKPEHRVSCFTQAGLGARQGASGAFLAHGAPVPASNVVPGAAAGGVPDHEGRRCGLRLCCCSCQVAVYFLQIRAFALRLM